MAGTLPTGSQSNAICCIVLVNPFYNPLTKSIALRQCPLLFIRPHCRYLSLTSLTDEYGGKFRNHR